MRHRHVVGVIATVISAALLCRPHPLCAQVAVGGAVQADAPDWVWAWSPLRRLGNIGLPAPRFPDGPRTLDRPGPRVGLTWTAGNPAGLVSDVDSAWTRISLDASNTWGPYRWPRDASATRILDVGVAGWRRLGLRLAAAGRIIVEGASDGAGGMSAFATPLASSPFAPTDTNRPARSVPGVRLEGAESMTLGRWQLGAAIGLRAVENHSSHSGAAMSGRASATGGTLGVVRALGREAAVGLSARVIEESETVSLFANPQTVRVYALDGFRTVQPTDIGLQQPPYRRRRDDVGFAWTLGASGVAHDARWSAFVESNFLNERQSSALSTNPPADRWQLSGLRLGAALQREIVGLRATLGGEYARQGGDATRASATGGAYHADAGTAAVTADVRRGPQDARWTSALVASLRRDWERVSDDGGRASTKIAAWSPAATLEVVRRMGSRLHVGAAYGRSQFIPFASLPSLSGRGVAYQTVLAPAIEIASATARSSLWSLSVRRGRAGGGAMTVRLWRTTLRPLHRPFADVPLPPGSRSAWGLTIGLEPGR